MSQHSYSRCWLHLVWSTFNKEKLLDKEARLKSSKFLCEYSESKCVYMKINFVNADHVHALIDLPTGYSMEEIVKLYKGSSSHWINQERVVPFKFSWARGYGAFSVAQSNLAQVTTYIAGQQEHHRKKTFSEEYQEFLKAYELTSKNR